MDIVEGLAHILYNCHPDNTRRIAELEADLEAARIDLAHGSTETWRQAARKQIELLEAELETLRQRSR
jgi:hypothetical protein